MKPRAPDQTLLVRALNSTKQSYFPSYIGLRLIGKNLASVESDYLKRFLLRRLKSCDSWTYKSFQLYKGTKSADSKQEHEYRECLAPSPSTALAGALILGVLAESPVFQVPQRVYSYRWPATSNSGSSFRFFAEGYKARNRDVFNALHGADKVAVVTDIKRFYPSVEIAQIQENLDDLFKSFKSNLDPGGLSNFFAQLLSSGSGGIPIGPAAGHLLGHVALRKVDQELEKKYGTKYFRYVDDIVVVCDRADRKIVQDSIQRCVESNSLKLNTSKNDMLSRDDWQGSMLRSDVPDGDDFRSFTRDLSIYLAVYPDRAPMLAERLLNSGLSIPINRLRTLATYSPFIYFVKRWNKSTGLMRTIRLLTFDVDYFLQRALTLKKRYEESLVEICIEPEHSPHLRRWKIQRARRVVNTLFYLRAFSEWRNHEDVFTLFPELVEQNALATSLRTGEVNSILPFCGQAPAAFSELWQEHGKRPAIFKPEHELSNPQVSSLVMLRLHGVISESDLPTLSEQTDRRLLCATSDQSPHARAQPDLSFEDEFESLRLGTSGKEIAELARTRHSIAEGSPLEALSLFGSEYLS